MKISNLEAKIRLEELTILLSKFERKLQECQEPQRAILEIAIAFLKEEITNLSRTINE